MPIGLIKLWLFECSGFRKRFLTSFMEVSEHFSVHNLCPRQHFTRKVYGTCYFLDITQSTIFWVLRSKEGVHDTVKICCGSPLLKESLLNSFSQCSSNCKFALDFMLVKISTNIDNWRVFAHVILRYRRSYVTSGLVETAHDFMMIWKQSLL